MNALLMDLIPELGYLFGSADVAEWLDQCFK